MVGNGAGVESGAVAEDEVEVLSQWAGPPKWQGVKPPFPDAGAPDQSHTKFGVGIPLPSTPPQVNRALEPNTTSPVKVNIPIDEALQVVKRRTLNPRQLTKSALD